MNGKQFDKFHIMVDFIKYFNIYNFKNYDGDELICVTQTKNVVQK